MMGVDDDEEEEDERGEEVAKDESTSACIG